MAYCSQCGTQNDSASRFCRSCGAAMAQNPTGTPAAPTYPSGNASTPAYTGTPAATGAPDYSSAPPHTNTPYEGSSSYSTPSNPATSLNEETKAKPRKKGKAGKIVAVLALILVVGGIITAVFLPKIERTVLGEVGYYFLQEFNSAKQIVSLDSVYGGDLADEFSAQTEISLKGNFEYNSFLSAILQAAGITADINYDKDGFSVEAALRANKDTLFKASVGIYDGDLAITTGLSDQVLLLSNVLSGDFKNLFGNIMKSDFIKEVKGLLDDCIEDTGSAKYNNDNCTFVTFNISGKTLNELIITVLEMINDNTNLLPQIDYMIRELKEYGIDKEVKETTYTVYYNSKGNIVSRELSVISTYDNYELLEFVVDSNISKNDASFTLEGTVDGEKIKAEYTRTVKSGKMDFDIEASIGDSDDKHSITFGGTDIDVEKIGGVPAIVGKFNFELKEVYHSKTYPYIDVAVNAEKDGKNYVIDIDVSSDEEEFNVSATIDTELSSSANISKVNVGKNTTHDIADFLDDVADNFEDILFDYFYYY